MKATASLRFTFLLFTVVLSAPATLLTTPVHARLAENFPVPEALKHAGEMVRGSEELALLAEEPGPLLTAEHKTALGRFVALNRAAVRYQEDLRAGRLDPLHDGLHDLREAYHDAVNYFETVYGSERADAAIQHTRSAMMGLMGLYKKPKAWAPEELDLIASNTDMIRATATRLAFAARAELRAGRVRPADFEPIERVVGAAGRFEKAVLAAKGNPVLAAGAYNELVDRLLAARTVLARFTMNTQGDYGLLWSITQSLNFIAPESAVAGFPYESRPIYRK